MLEDGNWQGLAVGAAGAMGCILQTCRYAAFGREFFGRDAIRAELRQRPMAWKSPPLIGSGKSFGLAIGETGQGVLALAADHYNGWIGRLWRVGPGDLAPSAIRALNVPADTDLSQAGGAVRFRAADHPDLLAADVEDLIAACSAWIEAAPRDLRRLRPIVMRAASTAEGVAVLLRVDAETALDPQAIGFDAALLIHRSGAVLASSSAPELFSERTTPRI